jgi:hypothetical protein
MGIVCVPNVWHCSLNERIAEEHFHIVFEAIGVSHRTGLVVYSVSSGTMEVVAVLSKTRMASMLALGTNV